MKGIEFELFAWLMTHMLRVGIAQISNYFEYEANLRSILRALETHAKSGVDVVLFPECVVTGFNTKMLNIDKEGVLASVRAVQSAARIYGLTIALPTPWPREDGKFLNSVLIIDENGEIAHSFYKIGFQRGEDRAFVRGEPHGRSFEIKGYRIGVLICIEASHEPWSYLKKDDRADLILWPGFYGVTPGETWSDSRKDDDVKIRDNLNEWKVPLIQTTCASSEEAHLWPEKQFGGSLVINSTGHELFSARPLLEDMVLIEFENSQIQKVRSLSFNASWKSV